MTINYPLSPPGRPKAAAAPSGGSEQRERGGGYNLPLPAVVETLDFEALFSRRKARLIELTPEGEERDSLAQTLALESEPITKLLQESAYEEMLLRHRINEAARANLIQFATGADLDALAAFYELLRLPGEADERFRHRLQLAIAALANNGTAEYYRHRALGASLDVVDAIVIQPKPGAVRVAVWPAAGADADRVLAAVRAALLAPDKKILGVDVSAALAVVRVINIRARIRRTAATPSDLAAQLAGLFALTFADAAALGREIPRSWIMSRLHIDGVVSVALELPATDIKLASDEYPVAGTIDIIDGGIA